MDTFFQKTIDKSIILLYNVFCFRMNTRDMGYLCPDVNQILQGGASHEENIPAQEETEKKGTWLQKENGNR